MSEKELETFEPQIIKTEDENGEMHEFELIDIVTVDDQEYGLLVHLKVEDAEVAETKEENDDDEEEEEVVVMRLKTEDDQYTFEAIEDDDEFTKVLEFIQAEMDEEDEDDDDDEDEEEDAE